MSHCACRCDACLQRDRELDRLRETLARTERQLSRAEWERANAATALDESLARQEAAAIERFVEPCLN